MDTSPKRVINERACAQPMQILVKPNRTTSPPLALTHQKGKRVMLHPDGYELVNPKRKVMM